MKNSKYCWQCIHCGGRNTEVVHWQLNIPKVYEIEWECRWCSRSTLIVFKLETLYLPPTKKKGIT